jgi:hypothetical protein
VTLEDLIAEMRGKLGPFLGTFPLDDMAEEFVDAYGCVSVEDVPEDEFWALFDKHDAF